MSLTPQRLQWYVHRLRAMPLMEIPYRAVQKVHRARLVRLGPPFRLDDITMPTDTDQLVGLHFPDEAFAGWNDSNESRRIAAHARSPERNLFSLLHSQPRDYSRVPGETDRGINWLIDPVSGNEWSTEAAANYRHQEELGEIKYVWELARMPWLLPRAVAARALHDESTARSVIEDILSYVRSQTPRVGTDYHSIHWQSGIEHAFRIVGWTWALAVIDPIVHPSRDELREIGLHVALAADHCARFPSRYSSANNHLIAEGAGLEVAGSAWPWLPSASRWRILGQRILDKEIPRQILPDGTSAEISPAYLLEVLEWSLAAASMRSVSQEASRISIPTDWYSRWRESLRFLSACCRSGESLPRLCDDDEASIFAFNHEPPREPGTGYPASSVRHVEAVKVILAAWCGASVDAHADAKDARHNMTPLTALLTSHALPQSSAQPVAPGIDEPVPLQVFRDGGIAILRSGKARLVFDCGPHGLGPLYAHAHADALSVTLDVEGEPVLVDPGTYCYHSRGPWRDWFRSTAAHNTVEVDGRDQSQMTGPFIWGKTARTEISQVSDEKDVPSITASHDGYAPIVHHRQVELRGSEFLITDTIESGGSIGPVRFNVFWHFAPGILEYEGGKSVAFKGVTAGCHLSWVAPADPQAAIYSGVNDPPQGWWSPSFSIKFPAPTLCLAFEMKEPAQLPFTVTTVIRFEA